MSRRPRRVGSAVGVLAEARCLDLRTPMYFFYKFCIPGQRAKSTAAAWQVVMR